ncbi:MAG: TonB-dependent receptor [Hyphomonadaceae bacterium]
MRDIRSFRLTMALGVAFSALAFTPQANAQNAPSPRANESDEIVVTARRREEVLQQTPVAVTALNEQEMVDRGVTDTIAIAESVPNTVITRSAPNPGAAVLSIRGLSQNDYLMTLDPAVGVYINDMYVARAHAALVDMLDVQRVEVLRGPQGTLFGRNTVGGAVRIITNMPDPDDPVNGTLALSYGNYDAFDLSGAITIPIVPGEFTMRYAGSLRQRSGYTTSYVTTEPFTGPGSITDVIDTDDHDSQSHRVTFVLEPTDRWHFDLTYGSYQNENNGTMIVNLLGDISNTAGPGNTNQFNSPYRAADFWSALSSVVPYSQVESQYAILQGQYDINDHLTARLIATYLDGSNRSGGNTDGVVTDSVAFIQFEPQIFTNQDQRTIEAQLLGDAFGGRVDWIAGYYYFNEAGDEVTTGTTRVLSNTVQATAIRFAGAAENSSQSFFGNADIHLTDALTLSLGGRVTEDEKSIAGENRTIAGICAYAAGPGVITSNTPGGPCLLSRTDTFNYTTWSAGLSYQFTQDIFGYVRAGNGFRGGGQQLRASNQNSSTPFEPDEVLSYEVGLRTDLFNRLLRFNVSYFYSDYTDIQSTIILSPPAVPTTTTQVVNLGEATIQGFEIETILRLTDNFRLEGSVGHTDIEFSTPNTVQRFAPEWKYSASAVYETSLGFADLRARVDYNFTDDYYAANNPNARGALIPGHGLLDARATLSFPNGLDLSIWGRNLLEEEYYLNGTVSGNISGAPIGYPMTYGVEARFSF